MSNEIEHSQVIEAIAVLTTITHFDAFILNLSKDAKEDYTRLKNLVEDPSVRITKNILTDLYLLEVHLRLSWCNGVVDGYSLNLRDHSAKVLDKIKGGRPLERYDIHQALCELRETIQSFERYAQELQRIAEVTNKMVGYFEYVGPKDYSADRWKAVKTAVEDTRTEMEKLQKTHLEKLTTFQDERRWILNYADKYGV